MNVLGCRLNGTKTIICSNLISFLHPRPSEMSNLPVGLSSLIHLPLLFWESSSFGQSPNWVWEHTGEVSAFKPVSESHIKWWLYNIVLSHSVMSDSLGPHGCKVALCNFLARILEWVAISFSRRSLWPRDQTHVSWSGRWILYHWEAPQNIMNC